jgi:hypothetical protein
MLIVVNDSKIAIPVTSSLYGSIKKLLQRVVRIKPSKILSHSAYAKHLSILNHSSNDKDIADSAETLARHHAILEKQNVANATLYPDNIDLYNDLANAHKLLHTHYKQFTSNELPQISHDISHVKKPKKYPAPKFKLDHGKSHKAKH